MKRILNLNDFSGPALGIILVTGLLIPAGLLLLARLSRLPVFAMATRVFAVSGGALLAIFIVLVVAEQIQDHILYRKYLAERERQGTSECPFCGNRQVRAFETFCPVCGERLRPPKDEH